MRRHSSVRFFVLCFVVVATAVVRPGTLMSVNPGGASPGVTINITGTGFSTTAAQNRVTFTPAAGSAVTAAATSVTTLDATKGIGRLAVRVPTGLPVGRVDLRVTNTATSEESAGTGIDLVTLALPDVRAGAPGAQNLFVRITGSASARFVSGSTRPAFGAGVTVVTTTVESPTSLLATVNVSATAALGPRTVTVTSSTQSLLLANAFTVSTAPPNQNPTANPNGPYSGTAGQPVSFSSAGSADPDSDPLTYAWTFGDGGTSTEANPTHTYAAPGTFPVGLTVSDGRGGSHTATTTATVAQPNRLPSFTSSALLSAVEGVAYSYQATGVDPDNDPLVFSLVSGPIGLQVSGAGLVTWTPAATQVGPQAVQLQVSDGRGGTATQAYEIQVAPAVQLSRIDVAPPSMRFTEVGATTVLAVTGRRTDNSTIDLTLGATGTAYQSSNNAVATVSADGLVTSVANGTAIITATNGAFSDTSTVLVELGVLLESLELTPSIVTLRAVSTLAPLTLRGRFTDASVRDLTEDPATTFTIAPAGVATVSPTGAVTAVAPGTATVTARNSGRAATADVRVVIAATGTAFLRGEVFDDSRGVPLVGAGASATLLASAGAPVAAPQPVPTDDRGGFVLPSGVGQALVRVTRNGFTAVDRRIDAPNNAVSTLLDARLTPVDGRLNLLQSVFGGQATSANGTAVVVVPPGSLDSDVTMRVTPLSNQGLQGQLPFGWSPIAAVDLQPSGRRFQQAATLRVPHVDTLLAASPVVMARYDEAAHQWVVVPPGSVSADRQTLSGSIDVTGQFAFLVPDDAPAAPPAAVSGQPLAGVAAQLVPATATATGQVVPRTAPPGDNVRATGTVVLRPPAPLPSGVVLRARVNEQFDLLDLSQVRPLPFVQDLVVYARPRIGDPGTLATRLPVTPTLQFTIQQLSLGRIRLDVSADELASAGAIVSATGGSVTDEAGNALDVPAGALQEDVAVGLRPLTGPQLSTPVPDGFTLLGAMFVDLVGATFAQPAQLSITRPNGLPADAQVIVAQVITDTAGGRRYKVVGLGLPGATRVGVETTVGSLALEGVRSGGEYAFLLPAQPLGFVSGAVNSVGAAPQAAALVTSDTAPFAFLTGAAGTFVVAGRTGVPTTVAAIEPLGATASGATTLAAVNAVANLVLGLTQTAPSVVAVSPAANATSVALNASIVVDFSKAIDPATVTAGSVVLRAGASVVPATTVLSANRRRLTVSPAAQLAGLTVHNLTLTSDIRDAAGIPLAAFAPTSFTTLDPSKPALLSLGVITAELPDEDEFVLITGAAGAADPGSAVVATNLRTQETSAVIALADGSFRVRIQAIIGDEIGLTLRDASRREVTISITQFTSSDGTTSIGPAGGSVTGAGGRLGRILPRALATAGTFHLTAPGAGVSVPALPAGVSLTDQFAVAVNGAEFRRLESLTLTESQGRFAPGTALAAPHTASGELTVPPDFLVTASLRFTATATDRDGVRRSASGATVVVASGPDMTAVESGLGAEFPSVFLTAPKQAIPAQLLRVSAVAPAARIELDLPTANAPPNGHAVVLTRLTTLGGVPKLAVVDRLAFVDVAGSGRLRTAGRELAGATRGGEYAAVSGPLVFVTGRVSGPAAVVAVDGSPFVVETDGANGAFAVPVVAGQPFALRFTNAVTGASLGDAAGQAPASGALDLGSPLAPTGGSLSLTAQPDQQSVVDIGTPLVFEFSEALDPASVSPAAFIVTDPAGSRAFGTMALSNSNKTVTFVPLRRWKYGTEYRVGVTTGVVSASGARMAQAFSSGFTTFAPRLLGRADIGAVNDVAVTGNVAVAATPTGMTVLDVARPDAIATLATVPLAGGARGVATREAALTDRNSQPTPTPLVVVASGDATTTGRLQTYSLATPAAPSLLGSTQLTAPSGQAAPANVPNAAGTPNAVTLDAAGRAVASSRNVGVASVNLGAAIPVDAANPGAAIAALFPAAAVADAVQSAIVGDKIAVATPTGLTILNAATLEQVSTLAINSGLTSVAGLDDFAFDVNGDGTITQATEVFDLVVAGDAAGVVQFYRVGEGAPELISAVRLPVGASVGGVTLSREEALAYVGANSRGLTFVDLRGPASVQPVDFDRDGLDDRLLASLAVAGESGRAALGHGGALAVVGSSTGLAIAQLLPPRVRFTRLERDPIPGHQYDEQDISESGVAFVTDRMLLQRVEASVPPNEAVTIGIEESLEGPRTLSLAPLGALVAPVAPGTSTAVVAIEPGGIGVDAQLVARDGRGSVLARRPMRLVAPPAGASVASLFVVPATLVLDDTTTEGNLTVGAELADGRVLNVTRASEATQYRARDLAVASVTADGVVTAGAGGRTTIEIANGGQPVSATIQVDRAPQLTSLVPPRSRTTLITSTPTELPFIGRFSDGSSRPASQIAGTQFTTSDPAVVTVDAAGRVTAVADGEATVRAVSGTLQATTLIAVELRGQTAVTSVDLAPWAEPVRSDAPSVVALATIAGAGRLHGLVVIFSYAGTSVRGLTGADGVAAAALVNLRGAGQVAVTATVEDPSSGQVRTDTETVSVLASSVDAEPNDTRAAATPLAQTSTVAGTLTVGTDPSDTYRLDLSTAGTLDIDVTLANAAPGSLVVVVRDASGNELSRTVATGSTISVGVQPGAAFVTIELAGQSGAYRLRARARQGPLVITGVAPAAGGPGTAVVVQGTGFSTVLHENAVLFGGARAKVVSVTPTRLDVLVPANAINGPITVISGAQGTQGPTFLTGAATRPPGFSLPSDPARRRFDPVSGSVVDVSRVLVMMDPVVARPVVEALAAGLGATVVGSVPTSNSYVFQRASNRTLADLRALQAAARALPQVASASVVGQEESQWIIDARDRSGTWETPTGKEQRSAPYALVQLFEAIEAIRRTPPFTSADAIRPVRVAVIDTGFDPRLASEFPGAVTFVRRGVAGELVEEAAGNRFDLLGGHGTSVAGIIAGANTPAGSIDGTQTSGVLGSLFRHDESADRAAKVQLVAYSCGDPPDANGEVALNRQCLLNALEDIGLRGDIDAVNMSLRGRDFEVAVAPPGCPGGLTSFAGAGLRCAYFNVLQPLLARTLVVAAAGNDGVMAGNTFPAALEQDLENVVSVGAVAVVNADFSGETKDERANFGNTVRDDALPGELDCRGPGIVLVPTKGSNCGPGVTLAASGEDFWTSTDTGNAVDDFRYFNGTSSAAPLVAGVAALLQTIRPSPVPLSPSSLRRTLVDTADDISSTWRTFSNEPMVRLNALSAVRSVLPATTEQRIFVTEQQSGAASGSIVALSVDPLTGTQNGVARVIPLEKTESGITVRGLRPSALVSESAGGFMLFVLAQTDHPSGDAVFVINTTAQFVESVIFLNGDEFPSAGQVPRAPVRTSLKSSMAMSRNGRLLFVSAGTRIIVIDPFGGVSGRVTTNLRQLHWSATVSRPIPFAPIDDSAIRQLVDANGQEITSLSVSPDGRSLYAVVQSGSGTGSQKGFVLDIDIALDRDRNPVTKKVDLDLGNFFKVKNSSTASFAGDDEPSSVVPSPDGKHVYVTNGGLEGVGAIVPGVTDWWLALLDVFMVSLVGDTFGDLAAADLAGRGGYVQLLAGGQTQVFETFLGRLDRQVRRFPSDLSTSWTPDRPRVADQFIRKDVHAKRPFGMAFRPDGRRALVPFFQTGNFGVLDLDWQAQQLGGPQESFRGLTAVTPSLDLDHSLWPPPAQEHRLYPTSIAYSQNGRFAVGAHVGARRGSVTVIDDDKVSADLGLHLNDVVPEPNPPNASVPYFSVRPLCETRTVAQPFRCEADVFANHTEYDTGAGTLVFERPRAVAIQPFVNVPAGPAFGDRVALGTPIHVDWRDGRATAVEIRLFDLGQDGTDSPAVPVGPGVIRALTPQERLRQAAKTSLLDFFTEFDFPADGQRFRFEITIRIADGRVIGRQVVEVVYRG